MRTQQIPVHIPRQAQLSLEFNRSRVNSEHLSSDSNEIEQDIEWQEKL